MSKLMTLDITWSPMAKLAWVMADLHDILSDCDAIASSGQAATVEYQDSNKILIATLSMGAKEKDSLSVNINGESSTAIDYALVQMCHQHDLEYIETEEQEGEK